jgi:hypothetical protein
MAKMGCAMRFIIPAIARNQAAKNAAVHRDRTPETEAMQIPSQVKLKVTSKDTGIAGRPKSAGNRV